MAFSITKTGDRVTGYLTSFQVNTRDEISSLPTAPDCKPGSDCIVIEDASVWLLQQDGLTWGELGDSSSIQPGGNPTTATLGIGKFVNNGTYRAVDSGFDGFSAVQVEIPDTPAPDPSVLKAKTIVTNGVYYPEQDSADGYNKVSVNVPIPEPNLVGLTATQNKEYNASDYFADGFDKVNVDVDLNTGSKTITENGVYKAVDDNYTGYDEVTVDVDLNLGTKTILQNGVYEATNDHYTGYEKVTVNVPVNGSNVYIFPEGTNVNDIQAAFGQLDQTPPVADLNSGITVEIGLLCKTISDPEGESKFFPGQTYFNSDWAIENDAGLATPWCYVYQNGFLIDDFRIIWPGDEVGYGRRDLKVTDFTVNPADGTYTCSYWFQAVGSSSKAYRTYSYPTESLIGYGDTSHIYAIGSQQPIIFKDKTITKNGVYKSTEDNADGYRTVTVETSPSSAVFHLMLDNYKLIYSYDINSTYTWKIGLWLSDTGSDFMGAPEIYHNGLISGMGYDTADDKVMHINLMQRYLYLVGIVYKNNVPIYSTIIQEIDDYQDNWNIYYGNLYLSQGEYKIDSVSNVNVTSFEPRLSSSHWNGYFNAEFTYSYALSYQKYRIEGDETSPVVEKDGSRVIENENKSWSNYLYPLPREYGGFTDLSYADWIDEMSNVAYAVYEHAGIPTVPPNILRPNG